MEINKCKVRCDVLLPAVNHGKESGSTYLICRTVDGAGAPGDWTRGWVCNYAKYLVGLVWMVAGPALRLQRDLDLANCRLVVTQDNFMQSFGYQIQHPIRQIPDPVCSQADTRYIMQPGSYQIPHAVRKIPDLVCNQADTRFSMQSGRYQTHHAVRQFPETVCSQEDTRSRIRQIQDQHAVRQMRDLAFSQTETWSRMQSRRYQIWHAVRQIPDLACSQANTRSSMQPGRCKIQFAVRQKPDPACSQTDIKSPWFASPTAKVAPNNHPFIECYTILFFFLFRISRKKM